MQTAAGAVTNAVVDPDRPRHRVGLPARLLLVSRLAAAASVAIGSIVLLGYALRWKEAIELHPSLPPMYPNAALGFVIGGLSAFAAAHPRRSRARLGAAGFSLVFAGSFVTLMLHVFDVGRTPVEGLFPADSVVAPTTPVPGRPVAETCVAFICVSVAGLMLAVRRSPKLSQAFALGTVSVGAAAILGYLIGVDRRGLGQSFVAVGMALHTAVGLALLGVSVLLAQPTIGLFGRLTHSGISAGLGRRLILVVVVAPIAVTAAAAALQKAMPDAKLALSVAAIVQILLLAVLVLVPMTAAEELEVRAVETLRQARALKEEAGERDALAAGVVDELLQHPEAPPGWQVGFRQEVAFGSLPGDSCQLLRREDDRFLVALIDVAGHGTGPALQAMWLRAHVAAMWCAGHGVSDISRALDRAVDRLGTIATGVLLDIDEITGLCDYVNAGHPPVLVAGTELQRWAPTQPLFGYCPTPRPQRRRVHPGDLLVAYTDGVTEAFGPKRDLLGEEVVQQAVQQRGAVTPQMLADRCMDAALAHAGSRLRDDALVIALQHR